MSLDVLRAELALFVEFDPSDPKQEVSEGQTFISAKNVQILLNAVHQVKNAPKQQNGAGKRTVDPDLQVSAVVDTKNQETPDTADLGNVVFSQAFQEKLEQEGVVLGPKDETTPEAVANKTPRRSPRAAKSVKDEK